MGILIPNMKKPKGCDSCVFRYDKPDDDFCMANGKDIPCDCPLIELPPHGRLIDADALSIALDNADELTTSVLSLIDNAPTIIESEGDDG